MPTQNNALANTKKKGFGSFIDKFALVIALIVLLIVFQALNNTFLSQRNVYNIILQVSTLAPVAIGMTLVILTGGIDLSVGSVLAFSQAILSSMLIAGINPFLCCLVALAIGIGLGCANGLMIAFLKLPPFIATLGMMSMARGLQQMWTLGSTMYNFPESFRYLGTGYWFGVPIPIFLTIAVFVIFILIMRYTTLGRSIYAVGGNPQAARISGISNRKVTVSVYSLTGLLVGFAAIIQLMRLNAHQSSAGEAMEMDAIACVVIGGCNMAGGRGSVVMTAVGTLIYGVILNGLNITGVNPFVQKFVIGALVVGAVTLDTMVRNRGKKD